VVDIGKVNVICRNIIKSSNVESLRQLKDEQDALSREVSVLQLRRWEDF